MSKKLLFKGGHRTGMTPYEIEDFLSLYMRDARVDEKTKAYIDSVIGNSVLNLCPYRNVLVTHKYDTVEGNVVTLDDCQDDEIIQLSEIQGNTMVNCNKDTDKELILMPNLDTNGCSNVTLTEGIDGGKVDVSLEGNTMVNVCDQEDSIAITKSYTVETGNHIALQGEYDGKCRPNIYGNTLVNIITSFDYVSMGEGNIGDGKYDYSTGSYKDVGNNLSRHLGYSVVAKPNTLYTVITNIKTNTLDNNFALIGWNITSDNSQVLVPNGFTGQFVSTFTTASENLRNSWITDIWEENTTGTIELDSFMILEGDYTNKPIPDYFTGMKSSFEDKLVPENLAKFKQFGGCFENCVSIENDIITITNPAGDGAVCYNIKGVKPNTTYTFYFNVLEHTEGVYFNFDLYPDDYKELGSFANVGENRIVYTMPNDISTLECFRIYIPSGATTTTKITQPIIVEGDYTNYDFTNYDSTKGGKYKVDYKVTGKNKFPPCSTTSTPSNGITFAYDSTTQTFSYEGTATNTSVFISIPCPNLKLLKDKTYLFSVDKPLNNFSLQITELGVGYNCNLQPNSTATPIANLDKYIPNAIMLYSQNLTIGQNYSGTFKVQIEEGTTATTYEPYKESIKTLYLNSPLLEGDTIEQSGNNIIHVHRYKEVVLDGSLFTEVDTDINGIHRYYSNNYQCSNYVLENSCYCDKLPISISCEIDGCITFSGSGFIEYATTKSMSEAQEYLQQNPITVVYLATPTQEIISPNDNLLLDSYTNGHLDVDSVVPIDKVVFRALSLPLKYLSPNTEYIIQFESDNIGKFHYQMNGAYGDVNVVKGTNKFNCTMQDTINWLNLDFDGIGFNASKIVVTPKVDNNFGYFKGMKSVGECEDNKIEILSKNKNEIKVPSFTLNLTNVLYEIYKVKLPIMGKTFSYRYDYEIISISEEQDSFYTNLAGSSKNSFNPSYVNADFDITKVNQRLYNGAKGTVIRNNITNNDLHTLVDLRCIRTLAPVTMTYKITNFALYFSDNADTYIPHAENKKEILLNEPLRGLPNGVKDKYVIIDGKWYIERNCGSVTFDGNITAKVGDVSDIFPSDNSKMFYIIKQDAKIIDNSLVCDSLRANIDISNVNNRTTEGMFVSISNSDSAFYFRILNSKLATQDIPGFKQYLQQNPTKVIYQLAQPTYEPIDYNPFEVYTDTTHISNNSTIPCNMVIKNSGYNCILKPNTTYTVSSSNGLSTVSTKDSIGDGILRFYNKDTSKITKMNNVLVLEGDYVTGNPPIPAFFKGMESAFEQELVTDEKDEHYGKYKITVKANNKNLFTSEVIDALCTLENWVGNSAYRNNYVAYNLMNFKVGTTYTNTIPEIKIPPHFYPILFLDRIKNGHFLASGWYQNDTDNEKTVSANTYTFTLENDGSFRAYVNPWNEENMQKLRKVLEQNIQTEIGKTSTKFVEPKSNNITFYINEPLRGVGDVKDKVYVKEDKVVVERNCGSVVVDDNLSISVPNKANAPNWYNLSAGGLKVNILTFSIPKPSDCANTWGSRTNNNRAISNKFIIYPSIDSSAFYDGEKIVFDSSDIKIGINKTKLTSQDIAGFKQWLQENPTTVVYQLATPVYEEVKCDLFKLALEGYNHGTLFYNSNIPITTQFYDFKVNIKDMLIPNETYYITFIADRVKDITINLSGVQVNYKTSMGYNKVPVQLGDVVNTNFSMDSRGVELSDLMISTSTSLIYVKDMNDVCIYDEASNKYSITITSTGGNESDKRVILLDYPLLRLNKDIYDRLYYNNKDSRYRIDKKVFKHKFTNDREYSKYAAETNDTYYSSFISLNETIKDYVVITNEKVKTVKVEDDKYYFKIKWSDLGVSDKTEANGNQGMKDFFNNNEVYLYYATDGFVEIIDGLRRQTLKVYQPETTMNFLGNTTTNVTIVIPKKNI